MNWLRLHTEIKDDRQLQQMPAEMFRQLISLWCIAKEVDSDGALPGVPDLAFQLRVSEDECKSLITKLVAMRLLIRNGDAVTVKNWNYWQYRDDSRNRVAALRSRKKDKNVTGGVTVPVTGEVTTADVTVTLTEKSRTEQNRAEAKTVTLSDQIPIESWVERLCEIHPLPADPRYPSTFCSNNWYRLGENGERFQEFMTAVERGLIAWCAHWALDGGRFAISLDKWLSGGGWKKSPPKVVAQRNGVSEEVKRIEDSWA